MKVRYLGKTYGSFPLMADADGFLGMVRGESYHCLERDKISGWYRVIDASGEDWLYPPEFFEIVPDTGDMGELDMEHAIRSFTGKYAFLRNDYANPIPYGPLYYPTAEHACQAAGTSDYAMMLQIRAASSAEDAIRFGRQLAHPYDEHPAKWEILDQVLWQKFSDVTLATMLLQTGQAYLDSTALEGGNYLGSHLMAIRQELRHLAELAGGPLPIPAVEEAPPADVEHLSDLIHCVDYVVSTSCQKAAGDRCSQDSSCHF